MESPLVIGGRSIFTLAQLLQIAAFYLSWLIVVSIVVALLLRFIVEALQFSPFGRFAYYATRPANEMLRNMRQSRFYLPLKRAFGFAPRFTPDDGIVEIKNLVEQGRIRDISSPRFSNTDFLRPMLITDKTVLGFEVASPSKLRRQAW